MAQFREIPKVHFAANSKPDAITKTVRGNLGTFPIEQTIFHPECVAGLEDFFAGDTIRWTFVHAEFQYIFKGTAEISYTLPPWHDEVKTMKVGPCDAYLIPQGADVTFKIGPREPLRHMGVSMPGYMQYAEIPPKDKKPL